jgi:hypothetical protein
MSNDNKKKRSKSFGKPPSEKKLREVVEVIASAYTEAQLKGMATAIDTAIDDSCEWEKYSDEGDDRRSVEQMHLEMLSSIVARAIRLKIESSPM